MLRRFLFCGMLVSCLHLAGDERSLPLFLIQTGRIEQAFDLYLQKKETGSNDCELLQEMGLALLQKGQDSNDPESQLLAIYGAGVSLNEHALPIIEEGLRSPHPQIQLASMHLLAKYQNDSLIPSLMQAMRSDYLLVRFEAASLLASLRSNIASAQILSLMVKVDEALLPLFAPLLVKLGTKDANTQLKKFLTHMKEDVRLAAILSIQEAGRDDYLNEIKRLSLQTSPVQQEACALALGTFKDGAAFPYLEELAHSSHSNVALAACDALYKLGKKEAAQGIIRRALEGDLFALTLLGKIPEGKECLLQQISSKSLNVKINAAIALLGQENPACISILTECLKTNPHIGLLPVPSPGKALKAWKFAPIPPESQDDPMIQEALLGIKEELLQKAASLPEKDYIKLARNLFLAKENPLVPTLCATLESLNTEEAIKLLHTQKQQVGAPLIRHFCTLSLFRLGEDEGAEKILKSWLASKQALSMIQLRPVTVEKESKGTFQLTAKESSRLMIETLEAFAAKQDDVGIEVLIRAIKDGDPKNRFALAGLLMRASQ